MSDSLGHLIGRAALVEWRVRALVAERRAGDPAPDDAFRGLYLSDEAIDQLLDADADAPVPVEVEAIAEVDRAAEPDVRLLRLARSAARPRPGRGAAAAHRHARPRSALRAVLRLPER